MRLGCHLSIAKGFSAAIDEAEALGINTLQTFSHSPSSWGMKSIAVPAAQAFRSRRAASEIKDVVVHAMYLLNLASPNETLFERSVTTLIEEVRRAKLLGIDTIVTHLGAHNGSGITAGIRRIACALDRVLTSPALAEPPDARLLLEDTAGAGTTMGTTFSELAAILTALADTRQVGVCLDTCHAFAAGYPLSPRGRLEETLAEFDREIGLHRLGLIHLNDSQAPLGSHRDRHAHIGEGEIGVAAFSLVINHPALRDLPFILETPKKRTGSPDADRINLDRVRKLREHGEER